MRKRNLVQFAILVLFALSGCGGAAPPPTAAPADDSTAVPTTAAPTDAPAPTDTPLPTNTAAPTDAPVATDTPAPADTPTVAPPTETPAPTGFLLEDIGLQTPESALYDPVADLYLVSNINGAPSTFDDNGFISRIAPDGTVVDLKWIDGGSDSVTLNAPKGMALTESALWVTDIDTLRSFDRSSGEPLAQIGIAGAAFLNDVAVDADGHLLVTDSATGLLQQVSPDGTVAALATVRGINGVVLHAGAPIVTGGDTLFAVEADGSLTTVAPIGVGNLDGLIVLADGRLVVSSWSGANLLLVANGAATEIAGDLQSPADIGYDSVRGLILVPHFQLNALRALPQP